LIYDVGEGNRLVPSLKLFMQVSVLTGQ
jgi:hypothetical protein